MNEFYEFDERSYQRKGGFWKYTAVALIFLLLGAVVMYYISPYIQDSNSSIAGKNIGQEDKTTIEKDVDEDESNKLPSLGAKGDLFITSDNPVVEISEKVGPAVVGITNRSVIKQRSPFFGQIEEELEGYGSGIIISEEGYIVTNNHVIENADELVVILKGGKEVQATLIGKDSMTDVAVIKIDEPDLTVAKIGDSDQVRQGELAIAIGNPLGHTLAGTVTVGVVSAVNREITYGNNQFTMIQTDAAINPGNSGGALVNSKGEVIGMNTLKSKAEGLGFAIPSNVFMPIVEELIQRGRIERPGIGVLITQVTDEMIETYGYPKGVAIAQIARDSAADKAGLLPNDIIVGVEGKKIETVDELKNEINKYKVGDIVKFTVWRDGKEFVAPIKLQQLGE
ncbi:MAG: PDZ domain-containing protein [Clostridiales bacterium]|nr:PDZ domain-containing protein [Clostridiales bacterium]